MLENALKGNRNYWIWLAFLALITLIGGIAYIKQFFFGLGLTGLSRDVTWGFYVAQLTFLVGVAAGGVMVVLPYYIHNYKKFGKITILGEFLAVGALIMCLLFLFVDLGQPTRFINIFLYPTPQSVIFWDANVLTGYLLLNIVVGWTVLESERNGVAPPKWSKPLIYISIPFAFAIHTVTAFLYCGLPGRTFWLTAILAPRFLASAFAAGPAFLILLCLILRKIVKFDPGKEAVQTIAKIVTYALIANLFFFLCEVFVALYSNIPEHLEHLQYLFFGLHGHGILVPWMWLSLILMIIALALLLIPVTRKNETVLGIACAGLFIGIWLDKGLGLISGGFIPSPLHHVVEYVPTLLEIIISLGIFSIGGIIVTILYKIAVSVKREVNAL